MPESRYRSEHDRARSVYRRANPWYRRVARAIVGATLVAGAAIAVTFGVITFRDRLDSDRLPASGVADARIRSSSFEIRSDEPAPTLDGTLTLDEETGAFEFVGRAFGSQAGVRVVSIDGSNALIRSHAGAAMEPADPGQPVVADLFRARTYLADHDRADSILTDEVRDRYLVLDERSEIGRDDDRIVRYDLLIDTAAFGADDPVAFADFRERAIPDAPESPALEVSLTIDARQVLAGVESLLGGWTWQRLTYSAQPFVPTIDDLVPVTVPAITIIDGNLDD